MSVIDSNKADPARAANIIMISGIIAAFHLGKVSPSIPAITLCPGLSATQAGFLLSLMQVAGASLGLVFGLAANQIGAKHSVMAGQFILFLASLLVLSVDSTSALLALRALESLGFLMIVLPSPGLLRQVVPDSRIAFRLGLWGCYIALGTASSFALGPLIISWVGWKLWWATPGIMSAICCLILFYRIPRAERNTQTSLSSFSLKPVRMVLAHPPVWFIGFAFALYSGQWIAVVGFLPTIYNEAGVGGLAAALLTAAAALVNVIGNLCSAFFLNTGTRKKSLLAAGFISMMISSFLAFSVYTSDAPVIRYFSILVFSAAGGLIPAVLFNLAVTVIPDKGSIVISVAWIQQLTSLGMLFTPPLMAAMMQKAGGWHSAWIVTCIAAIIGLVFSVCVARK
jgi:cyanate permease